jgi:DNA invertase Pin-like site-specific DNA recombinase
MKKVKEPTAIPKVRRPSKGQRVGYVRVSTLDQNENRQLEGIKLDRTFLDKASGKDVKRPQLAAMLAFVREGDSIVCHSMDRLGRNLDDLRKLVLGLTERGVEVQFLKENLTFTGEDSPMANLLLSVMGAFAQFERELIRERQREGIELAKRAGVYKGRKRMLSPERAKELARRLAAGEGKAALAREFGVDRTTVYRYLRREVKRPAARRKKGGEA